MITGHVTSAREAIIRIAVRGTAAREETVDAIIDTGFDGFLTLPASFVSDLALQFAGATKAALGDGSEVSLDAFEAVVAWDNDERSVVTLATTGEPLVGMALLSGYRVALDVVEGGRVAIQAI
jgi:clan AA aspartic protease